MRRWLTLRLLRWIWTNEYSRGADSVFLAVWYGPRTWEVKLDRVTDIPGIQAGIWERQRGPDA